MDTNKRPSRDDLWTLVQEQMEEMEEMARLRAHIERQDARLQDLEQERAALADQIDGPRAATPSRRRLSRAGLIKAGAAGAIGLAGIEALRPQAALANSTDGDLVVGATTVTGTTGYANSTTILQAGSGMTASGSYGNFVFEADAAANAVSAAGILGVGGPGYNGVSGIGGSKNAGVHGIGGSGGVGVHGEGTGQVGVWGSGDTGYAGVYGTGGSNGSGVHAEGNNYVGVYAVGSGSHSGIYTEGGSNGGDGIYAQGGAGGGYGLHALANGAAAVYAEATGAVSVYAQSDTGFGVHAIGFPGFLAEGATLNGVSGRGGRFVSQQAQIRLNPANSATVPASGAAAGDFFVDSNGGLHYYNGTQWKTLA